VNHLRDYVSVFKLRLQSVQATKGFSCRFGGWLSSVIDVRKREGDMRKSMERQVWISDFKILYEANKKRHFIISFFNPPFMYDLIMQPIT
jgi:hypothetical protein